jgi:hypothetical protein
MEHAFRQGSPTGVYGSLGVTAAAGGAFNEIGVEVMTGARYTYSIAAVGTGFLATAAADAAPGQNLDDDATIDTWTIDQTGALVNTVNDVTG